MPSRSLYTNIADVEEWKSGDWRQATSGRPGECGMVGVEGWRLFGGGTAPAGVGLSIELYRRTNQTAIRQTLSKNGFSPTTLRQRPSVFAARAVLCVFLVRLAMPKDGTGNARYVISVVPREQHLKGSIIPTCLNVLIANRGPRLDCKQQVSLPPF